MPASCCQHADTVTDGQAHMEDRTMDVTAGTRKRLMILAGITLLTTSVVAAPVASARGGTSTDVIRRGSCTGSSDWKLKLSPEDGRIEVEAEIDTNRNGRTWTVSLRQDGDRFLLGTRTTRAPSGSFEIRRVRPDGAGRDTFKVHARNRTSGEECTGSATI
jgi:hypothetical protein